MLPGATEREVAEVEESVGVTPPPPLELRRTTSVPLSLQSPGDRISGNLVDCFPLVSIFPEILFSFLPDSPQLASAPNLYVGGARIPHPHYYEGTNRSMIAATAEPPPAHRPTVMVPPSSFNPAPSPIPPPTNLSHIYHERESCERELERERASVPGELMVLILRGFERFESQSLNHWIFFFNSSSRKYSSARCPIAQ